LLSISFIRNTSQITAVLTVRGEMCGCCENILTGRLGIDPPGKEVSLRAASRQEEVGRRVCAEGVAGEGGMSYEMGNTVQFHMPIG
jgi:hypothetical protein